MLGACRLRIVPLLLLASITLAAIPAHGAKWVAGCPKAKEKLIRAGQYGSTPSLFYYIGHDVIFRLKWTKVVKFGGFSTEPDGNIVEFTFTPFGGDPIPLPPFTATAVSADTLRFPAPDTRPTHGRMIVGPAHIVVKRASDGFPLVDSIRPGILPPLNDVYELAEDWGELELLGAIDFTGKRMWIPLTFGGYGPNPDPPCPAQLTPITAFAAEFSLKKGPDEFLPHVTFANLKSTRLFLGDYEIGGINLYGQKLKGTVRPLHIKGGTWVLCKLNDTLELVMMVPLQNSADSPNSDIVPLVRDGSPFTLRLRNLTHDEGVEEELSELETDSLNFPCEPTP